MGLNSLSFRTNMTDGGSGRNTLNTSVTPLLKPNIEKKHSSEQHSDNFGALHKPLIKDDFVVETKKDSLGQNSDNFGALHKPLIKNDFVVEAKNIEYSSEYSLQQLSRLDTIKRYVFSDSQINTSGVFSNFTDIQNVMFSDMSLLELVFADNDVTVRGKTIGELYMEAVGEKNVGNVMYDKLQFDAYTMLAMSEEDNWDVYRQQVLGKLVRYGFADLKIIEKIDGADGFSAFVFEDAGGDKIVYFPCTNMTDFNDFMYDLYPVVDSLPVSGDMAESIVNTTKKMHESQQNQAKELLEKYVSSAKNGTKVNVAGFSLGGSLAEAAYLNSYTNNSKVLGDIVLFNPYHNRLADDEIKVLKDSGKYKLYVCEGDSVSTVFNYEGFRDIAKTIYIDYKNSAAETKDNVDNDNSVLNLVINNIKNDYCDLLIEKINGEKKDDGFWNYPRNSALDGAASLVGKLKELELNGVEAIKKLNNIVDNISTALNKVGIKFDENQNLEFLDSLHYIEFLFISTHLTYTVDPYKNVSFDKNGKVNEIVSLGGKNYDVSYPSFNDSMNDVLGTDPYEGLSNVLSDTKETETKPAEGIFNSILDNGEKLANNLKNTGAEVAEFVTGKLEKFKSWFKREDK